MLHGTEVTNGVEICAQLKDENLDRLCAVIDQLNDVAAVTSEPLRSDEQTVVAAGDGSLVVTPHPHGSNGSDDLRRAWTREALGRGLRASGASLHDLARLMTSRERA